MPGSDRDRRAVAGLVGYLLVFAVVIGGTVLVTTAGLGLLSDAGDEDPAAAERAVGRLADGVAAVVDGAPYRELRLRPRDAAVTPGGNYTVTVTASGGGVDLTGGDAVTATGEAIRYAVEGGQFTYAGGLVAYDEPGGADALARTAPDLRVSRRRFVFVLPVTTAAGAERVAAERGGTMPVVVRGGPAEVYRETATTPGGNATTMRGTVEIRGRTPGAWRDVFADRPGFERTDLDGDGDREYTADTDGDGEPEVAGARFETERLYVRTVAVEVGLGRRR